MYTRKEKECKTQYKIKYTQLTQYFGHHINVQNPRPMSHVPTAIDQLPHWGFSGWIKSTSLRRSDQAESWEECFPTISSECEGIYSVKTLGIFKEIKGKVNLALRNQWFSNVFNHYEGSMAKWKRKLDLSTQTNPRG